MNSVSPLGHQAGAKGTGSSRAQGLAGHKEKRENHTTPSTTSERNATCTGTPTITCAYGVGHSPGLARSMRSARRITSLYRGTRPGGTLPGDSCQESVWQTRRAWEARYGVGHSLMQFFHIHRKPGQKNAFAQHTLIRIPVSRPSVYHRLDLTSPFQS